MSEIRIKKRGKVYQYRFEIASQGGVRKYINKSGFASRKEAQEAGAIAYNEYYRTGRKQKIKDMSYADYLDYWMTNYCYFNVKYATISSYLNIIKVHLKPELGMYKLTQIDAYTIQNYINKLYKEKHYSKHYLKGILKLIKGSLKYACFTVNFINDNPADRVHIPKYDVVTGDPAHIFTQEELRKEIAEYDIKVMSWYPLGHGDSSLMNEEVFNELAQKYNKTNTQIILRWHIDMGFIVIPGTKNEDHILQNGDILDFNLTEEDLEKISKVNKNKRYYTRTKAGLLGFLAFRPNFNNQK